MPFQLRLFLLVYGNIKIAKSRLQVTQNKNKIIKFLLKMDPSSYVVLMNSSPLAGCPVSRRVDQTILNHIFKIKSGQSAHYMAENRIQASLLHSYSTRFRESGNLSIPKVKSFGKKSFVYNGCILLNGLLISIS